MVNFYKNKKILNFFHIFLDYKKIFFKENNLSYSSDNKKYLDDIKNFSLNPRWINEFNQIAYYIDNKFNLGLDIGCNAGYGTINLQQKLKCNFIGIDISNEAIELASKVNESKELNFKLFDGKTIPFDDNKFDIITLIHVIGHVKNTNFLFNEIKRVLKPGGKLIIITPNAIYKIFAFIDSFINFYKPDLTVRRYYFKSEIEKFFTTRDFSVVHSKYIGLRPLIFKFIPIQIIKSRIAIILKKK